MQNIFHKIAQIAISIGLGVSSFFGLHSSPQAPTLGTSAPVFVAAKPAFLYGAGISSSDVSIKLTALVTPNGTPITTAQLVGGPNQVYYATVEPTTVKKETVSCTGVTQNADGTALMTGCTRGLQFTTPYTASSTLAISHAGGSSVVISNSPQVYNDIVNDAVSLTRSSTLTGQLTFSSTAPPLYDSNPNFNNFPTTTFASVGYVASTSFAGTVNATETQKGISELSTNLEAASSTSAGSTGARLVLPGSLATSSCQVAQFGSVLVSSSTGKLGISCFDQSLNYAFTASTSFAATTTFTGITLGANIFNTFTASTSITTNQPVFVASSTGALLLSSSTPNVAFFDGFAKSVGANGSSTIVQTDGVVTGLSGLTAGTDYYVSTSGVISSATTTPEVKVGTALTATTLLIKKGYDQYISSFTFTSQGQTETSTACSGTASIPYSQWKTLVVAGGTSGSTAFTSGELTLTKFGKTSGVLSSSLAGTNNGLINFNASYGNNTFVFSGAASVADTSLRCSGTVYIYR